MLWVSGVAFVLHFVWEWMQCTLFIHLATPPTPSAMAIAAAGDVVLTWVAYGTIALAGRDWRWSLRRWTAQRWVIMVVTALALSVGFEGFALRTARWAYTAAQPVIPGVNVGLTPVLQLLILFPLTFAIGRLPWRTAPEVMTQG